MSIHQAKASDSGQATDEGLVRAIGIWALGANAINMVIGAGIFVLPGIVAALLGPAAVVAYLVCAAVVALVFLCFAEAGSRVTRSGGAYAYIEDAFGPFAGFVASMLLWLGWSVLADAAVAVAMTEVLATWIPAVGRPVPRGVFLVAMFGFLALINVAGLKAGIRLVVLNTIAKLVPLCLLAAVGPFFVDLDALAIVDWPSPGSFGSAALVLFFAFAGAETALSTSGEIVNPAKTIPRGLLIGIGGILVLYVALQTVAQGTLGPALARNTEAPLAAAATVVFGAWGAGLLLIGGLIAMFGSISGDVLNSPRVVFASARDGLLPRALAKVHPRYRTPYVAILFYAAVGCAFALSGSFRQLAVVASGSILLVYLGVSLAVIRLRHRDGLPGAGQFRIPGGFTVPVVSSVVVVWLLLQMTAREAQALGALLAVSALIYLGRAAYRPPD